MRSLMTFSPLFIGAMVATKGDIMNRGYIEAFSPLFIGAMVATSSVYGE